MDWSCETDPNYQQSATTTTIGSWRVTTAVISFHHNETAVAKTRMLSIPPNVYATAQDEAGQLALAGGRKCNTACPPLQWRNAVRGGTSRASPSQSTVLP
ncbi:hypothetical protein CERZMDRAFT_112629 [Cercospora zeae-maydis SCOH1-5]|uniref:Uncharacterized protein n=1 Tax=Cercospora zeae-maydis SCOH1-5 TaxID=717836 RepID=A0A6A6FDR5_9PEZI|nr:hypothetical protein CERZMDRAFT_112629 [Cercospora zeae-maydis SCOH1-5]